MKNYLLSFCILGIAVLFSGCTVKAVGDPNRPITINARITIDVNGLKDTAANIEDYVSGKKEQIKVKK
ncbi:MAG: hypothetical protein HQL26_05375 [Candidatus Omnitrophica bacterium]|nr:hypothetical protein [Candidatus Omnitrophota bacterium]